jgi:tyrosyl-tRNA synthetase
MMGQRPQQCFLMPILVGTDGVQKMSKSLNNYIAVEDHPNDMYGKIMSLPDTLIMEYYEYLTDVPDNELVEMAKAMQVQSVNPMELKKKLAFDITSQFHGGAESQQAERYFEGVVQRKETPESVELFSAPDLHKEGPLYILETLIQSSVAKSKTEAKRLIQQGAVEVDGTKVTSDKLELHEGNLIKIGKRRYMKIVGNDNQDRSKEVK